MNQHGTSYQQLNANGARFHLLLGEDDWGRCADSADAGALPLAQWWSTASPWLDPPDQVPAWDEKAHQLTLRPHTITLPPTTGEQALRVEQRRAAAADRNGNVYRIADDRRSLRVTSSGGGVETVFWPPIPDGCTDDPLDDHGFEALDRGVPGPNQSYLALAVTQDHNLVVAFEGDDGSAGLLGFDLVSGGPPNVTLWPPKVITPFALCPRQPCGLWLLDRDRHRLWELDSQLAIVARGSAAQTLVEAEIDDFAPLDGAARERPARRFPQGLDLRAHPALVLDPVALVPAPSGGVLVLDVDDAGARTRVLRIAREGEHWQGDHSAWLPRLRAQDFVVEPKTQRLFITPDTGNQALAFGLDDAGAKLRLTAASELFPLRRHAGRALLVVRDHACYDSGPEQPRWVPIVEQRRRLWAARGDFVTPVFDSQEPLTTWDKLLLDASIPPDTRVHIESRASDQRDGPEGPPLAPWQPEPPVRLRERGAELPWLRAEAQSATRRELGHGSWELLLQQAQGRYIQLRITLESRQRSQTPRLRALRLWSPRFSYPQRFLPAVYREDAAAAGFLERWLANFESSFTEIEDRVAQMHVLLDPRCAPPQTLAWLAEWFELALDPAWDDTRRRRFLRHAMDWFRWRGTAYGLRLALEMAFAEDVDERWFGGPAALPEGPQQIRIVEAYQTRLLGGAAAGDPSALVGPARVSPGKRWTPAEGNAGLVERWARWRGRKTNDQQLLEPFALVAPDGSQDAEDAKAWPAFCVATLGFVPQAGSDMRCRWNAFLTARRGKAPSAQLPLAPPEAESGDAKDWADFCARPSLVHRRWHEFLARRHRRIDKLRAAWGQEGWASLAQIPLPDRLPASLAAQTDWLQFERDALAIERAAHRFSVLLPVKTLTDDPLELERRLALARRIVELEKPAHTVFDVRFFWAFNRVGEARLGLDSQLGDGSRAAELIPNAVVGRAYLGASFVAGPAVYRGGDRLTLSC